MSDHAEPVVESPIVACYLTSELTKNARDLIKRKKRTQKMWVQFLKALQAFKENTLGRVLKKEECPSCLDFILEAIKPETLIYFDVDSGKVAFVRDDAQKTCIVWPNGKQWNYVAGVSDTVDFAAVMGFLSQLAGKKIETRLGLSQHNDILIMVVSDQPID